MQFIKSTKSKFFTGIIISFLVLTFSTHYAKQSERDVEYDKIQKSLKVMENVLNTILTGNDIDVLPIRRSKTSGVYIHNYGYVFLVSPSFDIGHAYFTIFKGEEENEKSGKQEKILAELYNSIIEFLTDYAASIKELYSTDRITVICQIPSRYKEALGRKFGVKDSRLFITAEKGWLSDYKRGVLNIDELKDRIKNVSEEQYSDIKIGTRIDIMKSILKSEFENRYDKNVSKNQFDGIYINGLGTIFTVFIGETNFFGSDFDIRIKMDDFNDALNEYNLIMRGSLEKTKEDLEKVKEDLELNKEKLSKIKEDAKIKVRKSPITVYPPYPPEIGNDISEKIKVFKRRQDVEIKVDELTGIFAEVFGDFGSTLKGMKDNEKIVILSKAIVPEKGEVKNVQFTINKSDINDYEKDIIDFDTFKDRINFIVY
ncbi:hypothetical protein ACFL4Z_03600 [candidate division KSB1 bacterium]